MVMFQDLHVIDFHAHFPVRGDVSTSRGGPRLYAAGSPAAEQAEYMRAQAERYRAAWRLAWDFPQPEPEPEAEDDTQLRLAVSEFLRGEGFDVSEAENGAAALDMSCSGREPCCWAITTLAMELKIRKARCRAWAHGSARSPSNIWHNRWLTPA
jgi:hypothetical protein